MHVGHLAGIGIHTAGCLAGFDVAPDHGRHVALVVHETGVEVGGFIGVSGGDVCGAAGEGVFEEVEHREEVPWRDEHVVAEPTEKCIH